MPAEKHPLAKVLVPLAFSFVSLVGVVDGYTDTSGSCNGLFGVHLPNKGGGDGGYRISLENGYVGANKMLYTDIKIRHVKFMDNIDPAVLNKTLGSGRFGGMLLKSYDPVGGSALGTFLAPLPAHTKFYTGCPDWQCAISHTFSRDEIANSLNSFNLQNELTFKFTWPAHQPVAFQLFLVETTQLWFEARIMNIAGSPPPPPISCLPAFSPLFIWVGFLPFAVLVLAGLLMGLESTSRFVSRLNHIHLLGAKYAGGCGDSEFSKTFARYVDVLLCGAWETIASATLLESMAHTLFFASQITALIFATLWVEGVPWQAAVGRGIGRLLQINMALVMMLPTRNSLWPIVFGLSFERYIVYHRIVGRSTFALVICHFALMLADFRTDQFSMRSSCIGLGIAWGTISGVLFMLMLVGTIDSVRQRCYELFRYTHMLSIPALTAACLHATSTIYFLLAPVTLYIVDLLLRLNQRAQPARIDTVRLYPGKVIELVVDAPDMCRRMRERKLTFGMFVYLRIPEVSPDPHDFHPFSISKFPKMPDQQEEEERGMGALGPGLGPEALRETRRLSIHIKNMGPNTWTDGLMKRALEEGTRMRIQVEGPYGEISMRWLARYPTLIAFGGGIGITQLMPVLESILDGPSRLRCLPNLTLFVLVWVVQHPDHFSWFKDLMDAAAALVNGEKAAVRRAAGLRVQLWLYATRVDGDPQPLIPGGGVPYIKGRPDIGGIMDQVGNEAGRRNRAGRGVAVVACGPKLMVSQVGQEVDRHGFHWRTLNFFI